MVPADRQQWMRAAGFPAGGLSLFTLQLMNNLTIDGSR